MKSLREGRKACRDPASRHNSESPYYGKAVALCILLCIRLIWQVIRIEQSMHLGADITTRSSVATRVHFEAVWKSVMTRTATPRASAFIEVPALLNASSLGRSAPRLQEICIDGIPFLTLRRSFCSPDIFSFSKLTMSIYPSLAT